ncbi:hypothetical protein niasHT_012911 [Heterodera trifolii]|uniref:Uncharacterized protein n=1 Tax=Heterodera trifolii TaxID=157864 RepID=A0ABD2L6P6_9BILA
MTRRFSPSTWTTGRSDVTAIDELDEEHILISYETKKEWVEEHDCSNIGKIFSITYKNAGYISSHLTVDNIGSSPPLAEGNANGCAGLRAVCCSTRTPDSLIFAHLIGACPLQTGPHLGQFTDEYPNHEILEFCSGGAKTMKKLIQYGLKLRRKDAPPDADLEYVLKVRGMTLNYDVIKNQGLRYETFKEKILRFGETGEPQPINVIYPNFSVRALRMGGSLHAPSKKFTKPFVGKGVVGADLRVLDFGHTL